jgi:hypothetical protein
MTETELLAKKIKDSLHRDNMQGIREAMLQKTIRLTYGVSIRRKPQWLDTILS